jgi:hypothetical protein
MKVNFKLLLKVYVVTPEFCPRPKVSITGPHTAFNENPTEGSEIEKCD